MAKVQTKKAAPPVKTRMAAFKLTPEQYESIEGRAKARGMYMGTWMRSIVLQAAAAPRNGRYIRIHEPDGALT
jgi:hypothetical protein